MEIEEIKKDIQDSLGVRRIQYEIKPEHLDKSKRVFAMIANEILSKQDKRFDLRPVEETVETLIKWTYLLECDGIDFKKGLLLKGHTGRGKSFLFKVLTYFMKIDEVGFFENGKKKFMVPRIVHVKQISGEYQMPGDKGGYQIIDRYGNYNCLVLDDIGTEQLESSNYANKINVVEEIINIREEKGLLTFGTTNLESMSPTYDDRVVSRMYDLFNVIPVNHEKDFRKDG